MHIHIHPLHPSLAGEKIKNDLIGNKSEEFHEAEKESMCSENDIVIASLLEALHLQRLRRMDSNHCSHSHVTKLLHALALEYKHRLFYEKAMTCLNEALILVRTELKNHQSTLHGIKTKVDGSQPETTSMNQNNRWEHSLRNNMPPTSSTLSSLRISVSKRRSLTPIHDVTHNDKNTSISIQSLLEEKSKILTGMGNIFKLLEKTDDAKESYTNALAALTDAGYPPDSPQLSMLTRLIKRL